MRHLLVLVGLLGCSTSPTSRPPDSKLSRELDEWARDRFTLSPGKRCVGFEQQMFGARDATCWSAKSRRELAPAGSRLFPRFEIIAADYGSDADAARRLVRFHETPTRNDERAKSYPLRAGFRVGSTVIVVTTNALVFAGDVDRVAFELAERMGGSELSCWMQCAR